MYIFGYIVIRTNQHIVIYNLRGSEGAYGSSTKCLPEHVYTTLIQHVYTTHQHNTQIWKLSGREKLAFIEVIKRRHTYLDIGRIQFILTHRMNKAKEIGNTKILSYKQ